MGVAILKPLAVQAGYLQDSNGRLDIFSLPGEIRNKVMWNALTPGQIHPYGTSSFTPKSLTEKSLSCAPESARTIIKNSKQPAKTAKRFAQIPKLLGFLLHYTFVFHPELDIEARLDYCIVERSNHGWCYLAD